MSTPFKSGDLAIVIRYASTKHPKDKYLGVVITLTTPCITSNGFPAWHYENPSFIPIAFNVITGKFSPPDHFPEFMLIKIPPASELELSKTTKEIQNEAS